MTGSTAREIAAGVERGIRDGHLHEGAMLPTVRAAAALLKVSPVTVASAYRILKERGAVVTEGRRGTRVTRTPGLPSRSTQPVPEGARDLSSGNPDPALLPSLEQALSRVDPRPSLYGDHANLPRLVEVAARHLSRDAIDTTHLGIVGGAADGIERVLGAHLRPGDVVAVEDPVFARVADLVSALGLTAIPVALDQRGPVVPSLDRAMAKGASAFVVTPRAQNPTGAALDEERAAELRSVLDDYPDALVVEDDHAGPVAGAGAVTLCTGRKRWATIRSVSKFLGPDLRLAVVAGDGATMARVQGRQRVGTGWVSHVLQSIVAELWTDRSVGRLFETATRRYADRRGALIDALEAEGVPAFGRSGLNVWIPVDREADVAGALLQAGWVVAPGERFRLQSSYGLRVTAAALQPEDAVTFAADLARILRPRSRTYPA